MHESNDFEALVRRIRESVNGRDPLRIPPGSIEDFSSRAAAVLVPVVQRPDGPHLLFVQRTDRVPTHKGQIAFPGGALEEGEDPPAAAVREAEEEVSLPASTVEIVGRMDDMLTVTSYVVTPIVGVIREPPPSWTLEEFEVEAAFETPLSFLRDPSNLRVERWPWSKIPEGAPTEALKKTRLADVGWDPTDEDYPIFFYDTPDGTIWGATAFILRQFLHVVFG